MEPESQSQPPASPSHQYYQPIDQTEEHLRLLSIFYYVMGGLIALLSLLPIFHVAMGSIMLFADQFPDAEIEDAEGVLMMKWMGGMFVGVGGLIIILGEILAVCTFIAGRKLAKREGYTFCMVIAGILCMKMPMGTILGIFTFIVLMKPQAQVLFGRELPTTYSPQAGESFNTVH